jgi:hypothetical protein
MSVGSNPGWHHDLKMTMLNLQLKPSPCTAAHIGCILIIRQYCRRDRDMRYPPPSADQPPSSAAWTLCPPARPWRHRTQPSSPHAAPPAPAGYSKHHAVEDRRQADHMNFPILFDAYISVFVVRTHAHVPNCHNLGWWMHWLDELSLSLYRGWCTPTLELPTTLSWSAHFDKLSQ